MAVHGPTSRPLPQAPKYMTNGDVMWAEIQESTYQPVYQYQQQQPLHAYYSPTAKLASPLPPSTNGNSNARWSLPSTSPASIQHRQQQYPFPATTAPAPAPMLISNRHSQTGLVHLASREQQLQQGILSDNTSQRPRPSHLNSAPSRFQSSKDAYRPFVYDEEDEIRRTGMANRSAFMHKGFFDIMSLVNSQASPSRYNGNSKKGGFKATFGKATGRFRKTSTTMAAQVATNDISNEDPFFSFPAPQMMTMKNPTAPLPVMSPNSIYLGNVIPSTAPLSTQLGGPRAQKKRISVDMIGAPCINTFVHAAHASDAEQAEEILKRWSRDGVGKIADPAWIHRCKEAMRVQAARNQAEAIAEVQAALHQDSFLVENPRALQIMNGAPSPSLTGTASAMTSMTGATTGHSNLFFTESAVSPKRLAFQGIDEEESPATPPQTPTKVALPAALAQTPRPGMMPRTNTQGTIFIAPSPEPALLADQVAPDYLPYLPAEMQDKRSNNAIDGLPGGGDSINALFNRRPSVVVRENGVALNSDDKALFHSLTNADVGLNLQPSLTTVEKSVAAKIFFENLYYGILKKPRDRDTRKAGLERELASLRIPELAKNDIRVAWAINESEYLRDLRSRVTANSFIRLKTIGHGAFGVVALVKERETSGLFAMKQLRKADMLRKGQEGHVRAERDLMTSASASNRAKWIVKLIYSFQDVDQLYLIMEFMGGGDLLNLLIEKDIFEEDFSRFYVAEMILAINEAHRLGYIHRDIKPDNFLFTSQGHIKLADFGLCQSFHWAHDGAYYDQQRKNMLKKHGIDLEDSTASRARKGIANVINIRQHQIQPGNGKLDEEELNEIMSDRNEDGTPLTHVLTWRDKNKKKIAYSVVGTNNYMAPEVLRGHGYDQSCDWWSLGVIVFEMLYGFPPFVSKSRQMTRQKILNWKQTLRFPPKPKISREAQDFITRLICEKDDRLGSTSSVSVSRPNSLLQGNRQPSGFVASTTSIMYGADNFKVGGLQDGVEDLMAHPWFRGIEWDRIHTTTAPFKPALSHAADTKHFEDDIEAETLQSPAAAEAIKDGKPIPIDTPRDPMLRNKDHGQQLLEVRKNLAFVGYTFKSPKVFDAKMQLTESKIRQVESQQGVSLSSADHHHNQPLPFTLSTIPIASRIRSNSIS